MLHVTPRRLRIETLTEGINISRKRTVTTVTCERSIYVPQAFEIFRESEEEREDTEHIV